MLRWLLYAIAIAGCGGSGSRTAASSVDDGAEHRASESACPDPAVLVADGRERGTVCPGDAAARGLVIVDLQDAWTPRLFAPQADGSAPSYRATYLALAAGHDAAGKPLDPADALGELYGVLPSLAIVRARLADDPR
ncbi:MAG TPA: hypothetical protein VF469_25375, partial [Kofleriaceae bacterium]